MVAHGRARCRVTSTPPRAPDLGGAEAARSATLGEPCPPSPQPVTSSVLGTSPIAGTPSRSPSPTWLAPPTCRPHTSAVRSAARFGESPHQYLLTRRLERAAALLRTTDWTVARICLAVGFQSQPTFTTSFGTHFGRTPTAYRATFKPAATLAVVPMCVTRVYGRPGYRTIRKDGSGTDQYLRP